VREGGREGERESWLLHMHYAASRLCAERAAVSVSDRRVPRACMKHSSTWAPGVSRSFRVRALPCDLTLPWPASPVRRIPKL
jgi:hypothetical protein